MNGNLAARGPRAYRHSRLTAGRARLACLALLLVAASALAGSGGFPSARTLAQHTLERVGQGTAYYARFIPVYDIALYAPPHASERMLQADVPKRLEIVYRVGIGANDLARAAEETLARQHNPEELARWRARIDALHASFRDVEAGDRSTLTYLPEKGLWLEFNDEPGFAVQDAGFAALYFGIWLGDDPLSESLRLQLLPGIETTAAGSVVPAGVAR